jgi:hypothetical protein
MVPATGRKVRPLARRESASAVSAAESRAGSAINRSTAIAAAPASLRCRIAAPSRSRGTGQPPAAATVALSIATIVTGASGTTGPRRA